MSVCKVCPCTDFTPSSYTHSLVGGGLLYDVGREGADTPGLGGANQAQDDEPGRRSGSAGPESGEQEVWSPLSRIYRTERQSA